MQPSDLSTTPPSFVPSAKLLGFHTEDQHDFLKVIKNDLMVILTKSLRTCEKISSKYQDCTNLYHTQFVCTFPNATLFQVLHFPSLDFPICLRHLGLPKTRPNHKGWSKESIRYLSHLHAFCIRNPVSFSRGFLQFFFCCTEVLVALHMCSWAFSYPILSLHDQHAQLQSFQVSCSCIHLLHDSFFIFGFHLVRLLTLLSNLLIIRMSHSWVWRHWAGMWCTKDCKRVLKSERLWVSI